MIATLKAYYRRNTFSKAHETHDTLVDFFKDFIVLDAVKNFADAWKEVSERNMRGVLRKVNNNINFNIEDNASDEVGLFQVFSKYHEKCQRLRDF